MPKSQRGGRGSTTALKQEKDAISPKVQSKPFAESVRDIATDKDLQIYTDAFGQGTVVEIIGTLGNGNEISFWQSRVLKGTEDDLEAVKKMYRHAQEDLEYYKKVGYGGAR